MARGVGIPGAVAPHHAERASATRGAAMRSAGWSRAGRRATTVCIETAATEVGDGLTAMPLVFPATRANGRRRTGDSEAAVDDARARRFT